MSKENITRPTMAEYKEALLAASAAGRFPAGLLGPGRFKCCYFGDGGKKCAIGILLPDEVAKAADEVQSTLFNSVNDVEVWSLVNGYLPVECDIKLAELIQKAHDTQTLEMFKSKLAIPWPHAAFAARIEEIFASVVAPTGATTNAV